MNADSDFIYLLRAVVNGKTACEVSNWEEVYKKLRQHNICNFVWELAQKDRTCPKEILSQIHRAFLAAIAADMNQQQEIALTQQMFEKNNIQAIMLKGWLMKKLYLRSDLRTMADTDIFIKSENEEDIHRQLLQLGYQSKTYGGKKDNTYFKEPYVTLEMHKNLFMYEDMWNDCFNAPDSPMYIWKRLTTIDGFHCIFQMDLELFYVYMIAHMAKHLKDDGGIGVRAFMDLYVYRRQYRESMDWEAIHRDFALLGLTTFSERAAILSDCWFLNEKDDITYPNESYKRFADYILDGGTYGSMDNFVINNEIMRGKREIGSIQYIWQRAFPSRASMEKRFPELKEKRYLLPSCWMKRLWRDGFHRMEAVKSEIKSVKKTDLNRVKEVQEMYQEWGL